MKTKSNNPKGVIMNKRFYMRILHAKHLAEDEMLRAKQEKELFIEKLGRETKITKAIALELKQFDKRINQAKNHVRSLKLRLRNG